MVLLCKHCRARWYKAGLMVVWYQKVAGELGDTRGGRMISMTYINVVNSHLSAHLQNLDRHQTNIQKFCQ